MQRGDSIYIGHNKKPKQSASYRKGVNAGKHAKVRGSFFSACNGKDDDYKRGYEAGYNLVVIRNTDSTDYRRGKSYGDSRARAFINTIKDLYSDLSLIDIQPLYELDLDEQLKNYKPNQKTKGVQLNLPEFEKGYRTGYINKMESYLNLEETKGHKRVITAVEDNDNITSAKRQKIAATEGLAINALPVRCNQKNVTTSQERGHGAGLKALSRGKPLPLFAGKDPEYEAAYVKAYEEARARKDKKAIVEDNDEKNVGKKPQKQFNLHFRVNPELVKQAPSLESAIEPILHFPAPLDALVPLFETVHPPIPTPAYDPRIFFEKNYIRVSNNTNAPATDVTEPAVVLASINNPT